MRYHSVFVHLFLTGYLIDCYWVTMGRYTITVARGWHIAARFIRVIVHSPISNTVFRQRLRSASSHQVSVPRYRLSTYGHRAFSVAGPTVWNSLPEDMRDPECSVDSYRQSLKTFLFSQCVQRIRGLLR